MNGIKPLTSFLAVEVFHPTLLHKPNLHVMGISPYDPAQRHQ